MVVDDVWKLGKLIVPHKDSSYTIFWFLEFGATVQ